MEQYSDNDIVISGIDGRYPKSKNVEELGWNLYNGVSYFIIAFHDLIVLQYLRHFHYILLYSSKVGN